MDFTFIDGKLKCQLDSSKERSRTNRLVQGWLNSDDGKDFLDSIIKPGDVVNVRVRHRMPEDRVDYDQTPWGLMLKNPAVHDPNTRLGKCFRLRFRVPYPLFLLLVEQAVSYNMFETVRSTYSNSVPTEIKILACLRILGRGNCADDISELSHIRPSTLNHIFKVFVKNFSKHLKPLFIKLPTIDELVAVMDTYARLGFPGAFCSKDVTHIYLGIYLL